MGANLLSPVEKLCQKSTDCGRLVPDIWECSSYERLSSVHIRSVIWCMTILASVSLVVVSSCQLLYWDGWWGASLSLHGSLSESCRPPQHMVPSLQSSNDTFRSLYLLTGHWRMQKIFSSATPLDLTEAEEGGDPNLFKNSFFFLLNPLQVYLILILLLWSQSVTSFGV